MPTFTQLFLRPQSTAGAILACVGGRNLNVSASSICSFDGQRSPKHRPRRIRDAFRQTMILLHCLHVQLLDRNHAVAVDDFSGFLMHEVMTAIAYPFVNARHDLTRLAARGRAFLKLAQAPLRLRQCLLVGAVKARILDLRTVTKRREARKANVNTRRLIARFEQFVGALNGEAREPFAVLLANRASLDFAVNCAVNNGFHDSNFRQLHRIVLQLKTALRKCEAVVVATPFEARETDFFLSFFATAKEVLKGAVNPRAHFLKHLRMNLAQILILRFPDRKGGLLLVAGRRLARFFIGGFAPFEQTIIEDATRFQRRFKRRLLRFGRIKPDF